MTRHDPPRDRTVALVVTALTGVALIVLALWLVPWHPVPGGTPPAVAADSVFTSAQVARAEDFARWARAWSWSSLLVSLLVAALFGLTGAGRRRIERLTTRLGGPWWVRVVLAVAFLVVVGRVITLPFAVLLHREQLHHGLSNQAWGGFARDLALGQVVTIVTTSLGLLVVMTCARRWQRAWPAVAAALVAVLVLAGSFAYPILVEPLFNSFTPLPDGPLRTQILRLAEEEGVQVDDVLVADASRRTTTLNAYVSGFGGTRRVVVYDNLVEDLPEDEALSVVAHELGHARENDVVTGSVLGAVGGAFGTGLLALVVGGFAGLGAVPGAGERRRTGMADPAVVPLVLALVALGSVLGSPLENAVSRQIETRADVAALAATHEPDAFIAVQRQLALRSLADPTPPSWSQLWFGSHPTTLGRIAIAEQLRTP